MNEPQNFSFGLFISGSRPHNSTAALVEFLDQAVGIAGINGDRNQIEQVSIAFFRFAQRLLRMLLICNIDRDHNRVPDGVEQGRLLRPIDTPVVFRLVTDGFTGEILLEAPFILSPASPLNTSETV